MAQCRSPEQASRREKRAADRSNRNGLLAHARSRSVQRQEQGQLLGKAKLAALEIASIALVYREPLSLRLELLDLVT